MTSKELPNGSVVEYDTEGNIVRRIEPDGRVFGFDADGNIIGPMFEHMI